MSKYQAVMTLMIPLMFFHICANAQQSQASEEVQPRFSVGMAAIFSDQPYLGQETQSLVVPAISYESTNWYFRGIELGVKPEVFRKLNLVGFITFNSASFDPDENDNAELRTLKERPFRLDTGLKTEFDWRLGRLSAEFAVNARDLDSGFRGTVQASYPLSERPYIWQLAPAINFNLYSAAYTRFKYGVSAEEAATTSFESYQPGSVTTVGFGLSGYVRLNRSWTVAATTQLELLSSEIEQSPLMDGHKDISTVIFATYTF